MAKQKGKMAKKASDNNKGPVYLVGGLMISVGILLFLIVSAASIIASAFNLFSISVILLPILSGCGLLFRQKWAKFTSIIISLIIIIIAIRLAVTVFSLGFYWAVPLLCIMIIGSTILPLIVILLLLFNKNVKEAFK